MIDITEVDDIREIDIDDIKKIKKLNDDEFLLKVHGDVGFMVRLNKNGSLPMSFENWRGNWRVSSKIRTFIIEEKYRSGWKFRSLRHGTSTAWVILEHPYGFTIEINPTAFDEIAPIITMVNGVIITPCYYQAKLKNATLLVEKDNNRDLLYTLVNAIHDDAQVVNKIKNIIVDERPDRVFSMISGEQ